MHLNKSWAVNRNQLRIEDDSDSDPEPDPVSYGGEDLKVGDSSRPTGGNLIIVLRAVGPLLGGEKLSW